jgi:hypothetical protein
MLPDDFIHWIAVCAAIAVLALIGLGLVIRLIVKKTKTPEIKLPWE